MDDPDERRRRWIDARELTTDQYMLVNFGHSHDEWQDNVDEARRDEISERVTRADRNGLMTSVAAAEMLSRLAESGDPTPLELDLKAAGVPEIYVPRTSQG